MMMADVGCIVNVSGSRIATPFGPPSPGSTPMTMPSTMPIAIMPTLYQDSATRKAVEQCAEFVHVRSLLRTFGQ